MSTLAFAAWLFVAAESVSILGELAGGAAAVIAAGAAAGFIVFAVVVVALGLELGKPGDG